MALTLSQHPRLCAIHEPYIDLIEASYRRLGDLDWGTDRDGRTNVYEYLRTVCPLPAGPQRVGIVDHALANLIGDIGRAFGHNTQVVWLVRDGRRVVASGMGRGWYTQKERLYPPHEWAKYRWRGDLAGDVDEQTWNDMGPFARNCWYWSAVNQRIRTGLAEASAFVRWRKVHLETLTSEVVDDLHWWLGVEPLRVPVAVSNTGGKAVEKWQPENWSDEYKETFERWCGEEMERLGYPLAEEE